MIYVVTLASSNKLICTRFHICHERVENSLAEMQMRVDKHLHLGVVFHPIQHNLGRSPYGEVNRTTTRRAIAGMLPARR